MGSTVPHRLVDERGNEIAVRHFVPGFCWEAGDTVVLGARESYRVLERRDGDPVVLVVEQR